MTAATAPGGPAASPAPIIVSALFAPAEQAAFDRLRTRHFPPERNRLAAHLTLFHHLPPSLLPELRQRLVAATRGVPAPVARATGLMNLGRGVAIRIESEGLAAIRAELAEAFAPLLTPQDAAGGGAGWRPHVTIQNKVAPAEAKATLAALAATFTPHPAPVAALAAYWYRGGPWEPISRFPFG